MKKALIILGLLSFITVNTALADSFVIDPNPGINQDMGTYIMYPGAYSTDYSCDNGSDVPSNSGSYGGGIVYDIFDGNGNYVVGGQGDGATAGCVNQNGSIDMSDVFSPNYGNNNLPYGNYSIVQLGNGGASYQGVATLSDAEAIAPTAWDGINPDPDFFVYSFSIPAPDPCISSGKIDFVGTGCAIQSVNAGWYSYFLVLLGKYWAFVVGVALIIIIWLFSRFVMSSLL